MNDCCKIEENIVTEKFKNIITVSEGFYYTVYITYCKCCGWTVDSRTWIE